MNVELIDRVQTALAVRRIGTCQSRRHDRKRLRVARAYVRFASCRMHATGFFPACAECREARTAAWYAADCPPMRGRWYREVPR